MPKRKAAVDADAEPPMTAVMEILAARIQFEPVFDAEGSAAFIEASRALDRIEAKHGLGLPDRLTLREALAEEIMVRQTQPELPDTAPELWAGRKGNDESPPEFIRRVYAHWLGRGLQRSHLHTLDRPLYTALAVWLHRHPDTGFPELNL